MIQALIFDFDGLILDTELSAFHSWQEIYQTYNCDLPLDQWVLCIGGTLAQFDAHTYLEQMTGRTLPREEINAQRLKRHMEMLSALSALPGIEETLQSARRLGLKIGLASNSPRKWVAGHLSKLGLSTYFDYSKTGDEVAHAKPHPELYLSVLAGLGVEADEAIALEDSPNGVRAAQSAGIFCIAIPNELTGRLSLDHADMRLSSLANIPLEQLLEDVQDRRKALKI